LLSLTAAAAFLAAGVAVCAPAGKPAAKPLPDVEEASPAPAAARHLAASRKNIERLGIALHNFASDNEVALPGDVLGKGGKPLLSWRVRLLPYLEQEALYKQFKLDQPWDSKDNRPLLEKMPRVFASPRVVLKRKGYTVYQVFTGPGAVFEGGKPRCKLVQITDGTSNTLFAVEAARAVPWTKPADLPFDKSKPVADFGKAFGGRPLAVLFDGSARVLDLKTILPGTLKNAVMPDDGNVLGPDWNE
jgi:hypothetical protein